jgi:hypothetical protein
MINCARIICDDTIDIGNHVLISWNAAIMDSYRASHDPLQRRTRMRSKGNVIVFGIAFWYPLAGVTYQFLHYLLPLRRLGYDVYYVEDSGPRVVDPTINDTTPDADRNVAAIAPVLNAHGFAGRWAFRGEYESGKCYGMSKAQLSDLYREADGFLNVTGARWRFHPPASNPGYSVIPPSMMSVCPVM